MHCPEERLDAVAISGRDEEMACLIIQAQGEFTAKLVKEGDSVVLVECNDDLTIAATRELVPKVLLQPFAYPIVVIQFTIHHSMDLVVRGMERLATIG